jgi:quercetin dioxygenase-like cupin family protein
MTTSRDGVRVGLVFSMTMVLGAALVARAQTSQPSERSDHALGVRFSDLKWDRMVPELGDRSAEIAILRVDPGTQATQLMIRVPKNFHVPKHWHTANETHTVLSGTFIVECEGQRMELGTGSFNYVPSKMPHEAWTTAEDGALLFITVDKAWDINWVGGPPAPKDFSPGKSR